MASCDKRLGFKYKKLKKSKIGFYKLRVLNSVKTIFGNYLKTMPVIHLKLTSTKWLMLLLISTSLTACFKDITKRDVVYFNDFEDQKKDSINVYGAAGLVDSLKITQFNNSAVLGRFNSNFVVFEMRNLPIHNVLKIEFDLLIHDDWRGNFLAPGAIYPEFYQVQLDNNTIYLTTFSNGSYNQSFPNNYQTNLINNKAFSNAWGVFPGVCSKVDQTNGTSLYKIEYITSHSGPVRLTFNDIANSATSLCQKSWSLDNLKLTAINN
jgi:hypothetical protein